MSRFDTVPIRKPGRNVFDLSHDVKATYKFDYIYPFLCQEIVPGDTFNCRAEVFMRSMPMLAPIMHNVDMFLWYVFVPNRLEWNEDRKDDWKIFITGGEDGTADPTKPFFTWKDLSDIYSAPQSLGYTQAEFLKFLKAGSLMDHLGMPCLVSNQVPGDSEIKIDSLPLRAYQDMYNELFRNQNVQDEIEFSRDSGEEQYIDLVKLLQLRKKCWEKDYFTACLPWLQRGQPQPMPLDLSNATISPIGANTVYNVDVNANGRISMEDVGDFNDGSYNLGIDANGKLIARNYDTQAASVDAELFSENNQVTLSIDQIAEKLSLSGVSVGTIKDLRESYRVQMWLENNMRCGSRYIEQILAHFGVVSSDARMQRPELLGGGKIPLIVTDIEQASGTVDNADYPTPQGNLSGKGTLYGKTDGFRKSFEEHGWLFGVLSIIPRTSYQQGLPRQFTRFNRLDYYFPEFANLSEQAVKKSELYFSPIHAAEADSQFEDVFGYQERFCEMRYIPSTVHGDMKDTLQSWHLGRTFSGLPTLNAEFVEADTDCRVFALEDVQEGDADPFICQIRNQIKAVRPLPKHVIPSL